MGSPGMALGAVSNLRQVCQDPKPELNGAPLWVANPARQSFSQPEAIDLTVEAVCTEETNLLYRTKTRQSQIL